MKTLNWITIDKPLGLAASERKPDWQPLPIEAWNATDRAFPLDVCVHQLVAERAAATPDAAALVVGGQVLSYEQLESRANRLAHYLRSLGVGPETIVAICLNRSIEFVVTALSVLKAGGAYLPLDPDSPADRLAFMLQDAEAQVLVTRQRKAVPAGGGSIGGWRVVALDADESRIAAQPSATPPAASEATEQDLAYVIYTSGSAGQPKGVAITHGSLLNLVYWHQRAFLVTCADRATHLANPGFDAAVWELWPHLASGAAVYLPDDSSRHSPEKLRDWLVAQGITISFVPTALAERMIFMEWPQETRLRVLLTGADTLHCYPSPALPFSLVNNYGPTECTVVATSGRVESTDGSEGLPSIGRPIDNVQIYILDENLRPVATGTPGELYIGGLGVARGYVNRPKMTAEKFFPDPFSDVPGARLYKTGDRARHLPDGRIAFLGRVDDQIKIRGYRIEPDEIVHVLNGHPAVEASAVVAREDSPGEKYVVAYVVESYTEELTSGMLRDFLKSRLPDYMIPAIFVRLDSLPLTARGKVDRAALPPPTPANTLRDKAFAAPQRAVEERVAGILAGLLGLEQVGVDDNFFLLGGHSLLGTQVIGRVRDAFGVELPLRALFEHPTVASIAAEVERLILAKLGAMDPAEAQ
jgi:amino acid adenylation domain-containing protein